MHAAPSLVRRVGAPLNVCEALNQCAMALPFSCTTAPSFHVCEALWTHSVRNGASFSARRRLILVRDGALFPHARGDLVIQCATAPHSARDGALLYLRDGASLSCATGPPLSCATAPSFHMREALWTHSVRDGVSLSCATAPSSIVRDGAFPHRAQ
ncbi:hypothetical protein B0H13DRAFT_2316729 [Mycena leptocephala]|nr:hypothetical protein B0H13DRAFT_2316729 [Mycena leptocephala]